MKKEELLLFIDSYKFSDEGTKKVFTFLVDHMSDIKEEVGSLNEKIDSLQNITIINGDGSKMPTTMQASDFHQMTYNNISSLRTVVEELKRTKVNKGQFKDNVKTMSWWFDVGFKLLVVIAFLLYYLGVPHLNNAINNLPGSK